MTVKRMQGMVPQIGQIVGCWFPHQQSSELPGGKFRPALVIATNSQYAEDHPKIALVYGTGQRTSSKSGPKLRAHEFELNKGEVGSSLQEETRFDCSRFVWLPFTEEWFKPPMPPSHMFKGYGRAPEGRKVEIKAAILEGQRIVGHSAPKSPAPKPVILSKRSDVPVSRRTLSLRHGKGPDKLSSDPDGG